MFNLNAIRKSVCQAKPMAGLAALVRFVLSANAVSFIKMGFALIVKARLPLSTVSLSWQWKALIAFLVSLLLQPVYATTPAGTDISNSAGATFDIGTGSLSSTSNTNVVTTVRTPASIELFQYFPAAATLNEETPSSCRNGNTGPFVSSADPSIAVAGSGATTLDPNTPIELAPALLLHTGDPIFIQVDDADHNLDSSQADTLVVNVSSSLGDQEDIQLLETDVNTGIFIGYIQSSSNPLTNYNCELTVSVESSVTVNYTDEFDNTDAVAATTLVDPFGIVFDSNNGLPIDGITVRLIDAATGQPAVPGVQIFGDDGISAYPNTLVTGSSATDSNGTVVIFPEGGYRFPLLLPGDYQLQVFISPGYAAPSLLDITELQILPNAPFALYDDASFGNTFTLNPGPPLHVDIPVDPITVQLVVEKTASDTQAGAGDFVRYRVTVENADTVASARQVLVNDILPQGFRYQAGSARLNNSVLSDPVIAQDGRTLEFATQDLAPGESLELTYVTEVTAGTPLGDALNSASATDSLAATSNIAQALIEIRDEFMREHVTIVGRVIVGNCPLQEASEGKAGIGLQGQLYEDLIDYQVDLSVSSVAVANYSVNILIPNEVDYLPGSSRLDGIAITDPERVSNRLVYRLGNGDHWPIDWQHQLQFRVQLKSGVKRGADLKTKAYSQMDTLHQTGQKTKTAVSLLSNTVSPLQEQANSGIQTQKIIGYLGGREDAVVGTELEGLEGVRLFLENGTFVVSDAEGKYHFEGVLPGAHVVQLDEDSLPSDMQLISCEKNTRFAGKANSQFVDVKGGTLWRADFHVQQKPAVLSTATLAMNSEVVGKDVQLALHMENGAVPLNNYRLTVMLPDGMNYQLGSSEVNGKIVSDPEINGTILVYRLGGFADNAKKTFKLKLSLLDMIEGQLSIKAFSLFDTKEKKNNRIAPVENIIHKKEDRYAEKLFVFQPKFASFETKLSDEDKRELDQFIQSLNIVSIENLLVVGHSDNLPIKRENQHIFKDNYELSEARAKVVADYIREALGLDQESVVSEGKGPDQAVADNATLEGRAKNRRTELYINTVQLASEGKVSAVRSESGVEQMSISGRKVEKPRLRVAKPPEIRKHTIKQFDLNWLQTQQPGVEWLFPVEGFIPKIPAVNVAIKHYPTNKIEASINGETLNPLFFFGVDANEQGTVARSYWQGIHLKDGPNHLEFVIKDENNQVVSTLKRTMHFSGAPVRAELVKTYSNLVADGITAPLLAVKFLDEWGHPVRPGITGQFTVSEPYMPKEYFESLKKEPLFETPRLGPQYQVNDHGIAMIELMPTTQSGKVQLEFRFNDGKYQEIKAWLKPSQRDWIVVGLADATLGSNSLDGNDTSAKNAGFEEGGYEDGKFTMFAKGTIKNDWLVTASIDTSKDKETVGDRLFQTIDPDEHFTLYGDKTEQYYEAPSSQKLFAKIEKEQFYAMFGDYTTGLNETELSKYSRSVTGLKSEFHGDIFSVNAFATETSQRFVKDEMQGDGTSGLYRLSQGGNIIINSETIVIETRDRFHSQDILHSRQMRRHFDYDIDYLSGTIFFKEPIASRDQNFNSNIIVVEYEVETDLIGGTSGGGRAAVNLLGDKLEIGVSAIRDEAFQLQGDLYGTDITFKVNEDAEINLEYAGTEVDDAGSLREGAAYLAEYKHFSETLDGRVYFREQETAFGLGQQSGSETGTRKYGLDAGYRLTDTIRLNTEIFHEDNLVTSAQRDVTEFDVAYSDRIKTAMIGLRSALDENPLGETRESELLLLGGSYEFAQSKLMLRMNNEIALNAQDENPDYPSRYILGLDYLWKKNINLYVEHEITEGALQDTSSTRAGVRASPWTDGQINTAVEERSNEFGPRVFSTLGLTQKFDISDRWSGGISLDRVDTMRDPGNIPFNINVPPASGTVNEDFVAISLDTNYLAERSTFVNRIETRESDNEDRKGVYLGWYRDESEGIGYSLKSQWYSSEFVGGTSASTLDARFSFSYRPVDSNWIHLNRFDYIYDLRSDALGSEQRGRKFINNWKGNYLINRNNQIAFSYGLKYTLDSFDSDEYSGITQYIGTEYRRDINPKWDIGLRGSILHSQKAKNYTHSYGVDVGWTMVDNMWLSMGYNFDGFEDPDFSLAGYTAKGFFIKLRMKFDQHLFHDIKNRRRK